MDNWIETNDFNVLLPKEMTGKYYVTCGKYLEKFKGWDVLSLSWEDLNALTEHLKNTIKDIEANPKRFFKD